MITIRTQIFLIVLALVVGNTHAYGQCQEVQTATDSYVYSLEDFGQSFKACSDGVLTRLEIPMHHFLDGDIQCQISVLDGEGYAGEQLFTQNITLTDEWGSYAAVQVQDSIPVLAGATYTIKLEFFGEYGLIWANFNNIYPDGQFYWDGETHDGMDMGFTADIFAIEQWCVQWTGAVSNDWNEALNWVPAVVPDSMDCVYIGVSDFGNQPMINQKAYAASVHVAVGGDLDMLSTAFLQVHGDFLTEENTALDGSLILQHEDNLGEISGHPYINMLKVNGLFYASEPFDVMQVLDLESGYLVNLATEVYVHSGVGHAGHVYMPNDAMAGDIIFKRHLSESGLQTQGLPFQVTSAQDIADANDIAFVSLFEAVESFEEFELNWQEHTDSTTPLGVQGAVSFQTELDLVELKGQAVNTDQVFEGLDRLTTRGDNAGLRLIGNPYPSIVDWDRVEYPEGVPQATYGWDSERQQFGARVQALYTHDRTGRIYPTEALMIELNQGENFNIAYKDVVLDTEEIWEDDSEELSDIHSLKLAVSAPQGDDELLIAFIDESRVIRDDKYDALKIPSMNAVMPTVGSIEPNGDILAINSLPHPEVGTIIPLYVHPGAEGTVTFTPQLIDVGPEYNGVFLHDRKLNVFHNLMQAGGYQAQVTFADDRDRFVLHFGRKSLIALETPGPWDIGTTDNEVIVAPFAAGQEVIKENTLLTVHSVDGRLVLEKLVVDPSTELRYQLHVSPGYYVITLTEGDRIQSEKHWLD